MIFPVEFWRKISLISTQNNNYQDHVDLIEGKTLKGRSYKERVVFSMEHFDR